MTLEIFSVYDSKVEAYLQPFFLRAKGEAVRAFEETVNDPATKFNKYPADYTLFRVGQYDDRTGTVTKLDVYENLGNAVTFKKAPPAAPAIDKQKAAQEYINEAIDEIKARSKNKKMGSKPAQPRKR